MILTNDNKSPSTPAIQPIPPTTRSSANPRNRNAIILLLLAVWTTWGLLTTHLYAEDALAQARMLEGRDEPLAASMQYILAAQQARQTALQNGEDAPALWARVAFCYEKSFVLSRQTGECEDLVRKLATDDKDAPAWLNTYKLWKRAELALDTGKPDDARKILAPLNLPTAWFVLGPFDNENGRSFDTPFIDETDKPFSLNAIMGKQREVQWRTCQVQSPMATASLGKWLRPAENCLAYAACLVHSSAAQPAVLHLSSDDGISAWLNGTSLVHEPLTRALFPDQNTVGCSLQKGFNLLLIKCSQVTGSWQFRARFSDLDGAPLSGIRYTASQSDFEKHLSEVNFTSSNLPQAKLPGITAALTYAADHSAKPSEWQHELGWLISRWQIAGVDSMLPRQLLQQATQDDPDTAALRWLDLAEVARIPGTGPDRDENFRLDCLGTASEKEETMVASLALLAEYDLHTMLNPHRAEPVIAKALAKNPLSPLALALQYDLSRERGWDMLALQQIAEMVRQSPLSIEIRLREAKLGQQQSNPADALEALRPILRVHATNEEAARLAVQLSLQLGQPENADNILKQFLALMPLQQWAVLKRAEVLQLLGKSADALGMLDQALAACPENDEFLAAKGDILFAQGKTDEATACWSRALLLEPGLTRAKDLVEAFGQAEPEEPALTQIPDLAVFSAQHTDKENETAKHSILLQEEIDRIHGDGTFSKRTHQVVRVLHETAIEKLSMLPVFWNAENDRVILHTARVLHADGSVSQGRLHMYRPGVSLIQLPLSDEGDVFEYDFEIERSHPDFFGDYFARIATFGEFVPVHNRRYTLVFPKDKPIYFHLKNGMKEASLTEDDANTIRLWQMTNLTGILEEDHMPPLSEIVPTLEVSTFKDWDELAKWYWHLIKSQHQITDELRDTVEKITAGKLSDREKIEAIYEWVAGNIRNVTWPFGVHGFKPYKADTIYSRRFGDCKDKSTLINVMAREAGLASSPLLLRATDPSEPRIAARGEEDLSLPMLLHFNHAISYTQIDGKDFWLDATIPYRTCAGVPFSDAGAQAVIVGPDGASRVQLPGTNPEDNAITEDLRMTFNEIGGSEIEQILTLTGRPAEMGRALFGIPNRRDLVLRSLGGKVFGNVRAARIDEYDTDTGADTDTVTVNGRLIVLGYARELDQTLRIDTPKMFLRESLKKGGALPDNLSEYAPYSTRKHELMLPMRFKLHRTISLTWPAGWQPRNLPTERKLDYPFATCTISPKLLGRTLTTELLVEWKTNRIATADYADFRSLCAVADDFDNFTLILEKP